MKYFLGIEVIQFEDGIFLCEYTYENDVLKRFRMVNRKLDVTLIGTDTKLSKEDDRSKFDPMMYKRLVGSLMHLTATRLDIMFAVSLISRFTETPKSTQWQDGKRILRYIAGTTNFGIQYTSNSNFKLIRYTDSDFADSIDDKKNTGGYVSS